MGAAYTCDFGEYTGNARQVKAPEVAPIAGETADQEYARRKQRYARMRQKVGYKKEGEASIVDAIGAGGEMFASKLGSRLDAAGSLVSSAAGAVLTPEALDSLAQKRKSLATWVGKASGAY